MANPCDGMTGQERDGVRDLTNYQVYGPRAPERMLQAAVLLALCAVALLVWAIGHPAEAPAAIGALVVCGAASALLAWTPRLMQRRLPVLATAQYIEGPFGEGKGDRQRRIPWATIAAVVESPAHGHNWSQFDERTGTLIVGKGWLEWEALSQAEDDCDGLREPPVCELPEDDPCDDPAPEAMRLSSGVSVEAEGCLAKATLILLVVVGGVSVLLRDRIPSLPDYGNALLVFGWIGVFGSFMLYVVAHQSGDSGKNVQSLTADGFGEPFGGGKHWWSDFDYVCQADTAPHRLVAPIRWAPIGRRALLVSDRDFPGKPEALRLLYSGRLRRTGEPLVRADTPRQRRDWTGLWAVGSLLWLLPCGMFILPRRSGEVPISPVGGTLLACVVILGTMGTHALSRRMRAARKARAPGRSA